MKKEKVTRILSEAYTKIRIVDDKGVTVAIIDEYDATPIPDDYTIVLTPNYEYKN